MKPFIASEFISNQDTPVICRNKKPAEIITVKGRGEMPILGYVDKSQSVSTWNEVGMFYASSHSELDLFFAPKIEVVHVFLNTESGKTESTIRKDQSEHWRTYKSFTYLGTITGSIVPPEEGK